MDVLSVLENSESERIHNVIVGVFDVVLEVLPVFPPHDIYQLEPQLLIKVVAPLRSADRISQYIGSFYLGPSLEMFHGNPFPNPRVQ